MPEITSATVWTVAMAALAALMVPGYALFDLGSVRRKNTSGTIVRHLLVTFVAVLSFLFMGFGLFFGGKGGFFGVLDFFTLGNYGPDLPEGVSFSLFVASEAVIVAVLANVVCGALSERSNLGCMVAVGIVVGLLVYPFVSRWTWGTGWLAQLGFHDFAGSASLNVVAGVVALVACALMGPRAGKYDAEKKGGVSALPGQSMTLCLEGTLLVFVGWFGLMGVSLVVFGTSSYDSLGNAYLVMLVSASVSTLMAMAVSQLRYGCIDVPMSLNGLIGGLVAVSSGADIIFPLEAVLVGVFAGLVVVFGSEWIERILRVDDPVGAIATHGLCGLLGLAATGVFGEGGLFWGNPGFLGVELLGALAICAWSAALAWVVLYAVRSSHDLRVLDDEETGGLGLSGTTLNNAFVAYMPAVGGSRGGASRRVPDLPVDQAVPLVLEGGANGCSLKLVQIVCRPARLSALRERLSEVGVTGMTVSEVSGCGEQQGARETYRGVPVDVKLVPKVRVDVVVSKVPVADVVTAARRALYTGHIGDGKIFVFGVAEAVKVRTGEHGFDAVQSVDEVTS
ncbi:MAG: ammonium transporter [Tractidigestivibacter sp.]|jgi:Amt family ammonium transporter|uniref:ammonium transporter n=1 Tax=Tractidigestivibacter sp. TaxID=2847320 RepID=UPI003D8C55EE